MSVSEMIRRIKIGTINNRPKAKINLDHYIIDFSMSINTTTASEPIKNYLCYADTSPVEVLNGKFLGLKFQERFGTEVLTPDNLDYWDGVEDLEYNDVSNISLVTSKGTVIWDLCDGIGNITNDIQVLVRKVQEVGKMDSLKVKIKYFDDELERIQKIAIGDWIDLRSAVTVSLKKGEHMYLPLGVAMELPDGYEAWLVGRSSTAKKFGVVHCDDVGVIDGSYCGDNDEWKLPIIALRDTTIHKNDRICQFRIHEVMPSVEFEEVDSLGNPDRGGLGSTGVK